MSVLYDYTKYFGTDLFKKTCLPNIRDEEARVNSLMQGVSANEIGSGVFAALGKDIGIELPVTVKLKVTHTVPGVKGDTVSNVTKSATLETGAEVQVPLFVSIGNEVKVDTRTGEYIERVK